ncbi:hypothetical protein EUX98_g6522 [Antrodiella citrinella]|uniref:Uncharacterized protein n=1 Tax=Antrodiella citrinella TaxID=2447956 RepID=A0A4S4MNS4_9APHY|nr:hypothetical protein EUX98_g6522 [Antrodiella citrinella]
MNEIKREVNKTKSRPVIRPMSAQTNGRKKETEGERGKLGGKRVSALSTKRTACLFRALSSEALTVFPFTVIPFTVINVLRTMLNRSSVAVVGGRHILERAVFAKTLSSREPARCLYSQKAPVDVLETMHLKNHKAHEDIAASLVPKDADKPKVADEQRPGRAIPTATSFHDIFIRHHGLPMTRVSLLLRVQTTFAVHGRLTQVWPHDHLVKVGPHDHREQGNPRGNVEYKERDSGKDNVRLTKANIRLDLMTGDLERLKEMEKPRGHGYHKKSGTPGEVERGATEKRRSEREMMTNTRLSTITTQMSSPTKKVSAEVSDSTKTATVAEATSLPPAETADTRVPTWAVDIIAARSQLYIEQNGGDYSRYGKVYDDIVTESENTLSSLGPVRFAELYINKHPNARLDKRKQAVGIVKNLINRVTRSPKAAA